MSNLKFCPNCNITKENAELKAAFAELNPKLSVENIVDFNKGYLWGIKPEDGDEFILCPFCQTKVVDAGITQEDFAVLESASNYNRQFLEAMIKLHDEDIIEYELKMSQFRLQVEQQSQIKKSTQEDDKPKCPHCKSTNISKIGTGERVGSIAMWGIFSKKINKSFKCKSCDYTW